MNRASKTLCTHSLITSVPTTYVRHARFRVESGRRSATVPRFDIQIYISPTTTTTTTCHSHSHSRANRAGKGYGAFHGTPGFTDLHRFGPLDQRRGKRIETGFALPVPSAYMRRLSVCPSVCAASEMRFSHRENRKALWLEVN